MITKTYAHILDEDRKINTQKSEASLHSNPDLRTVRAPQEQKTFSQPQVPQAASDFAMLLLQPQQKPELIGSLWQIFRQINVPDGRKNGDKRHNKKTSQPP